jgi:VWFA-related protein
VLRTLDDNSYRKALNGASAGLASQLVSFEDDLSRVSSLCGDLDPSVQGKNAEQKACQVEKLSLSRRVETIANQERLSEKSFLAELRSVIDQLAKSNDRRTVVLISDGFGTSPGRDVYELAFAYLPTMNELALQGVTPDQTDLAAIRQAAQKSNIPIYTIDARGVYADKTMDASRQGISRTALPRVQQAWQSIQTGDGETLREIAAATGGVSFRNNNDLLPGLDRAFADGRDYYTLAYVPGNNTADGKFRRIQVRLRDARLQASFKQGYWADKP